VRILRSVKFSRSPSQSETCEDLLTLVRYADDSDSYGVWLADHFIPEIYVSPEVTSNTVLGNIVHQIALGYGPGRIDTLAGLREDVSSAFPGS